MSQARDRLLRRPCERLDPQAAELQPRAHRRSVGTAPGQGREMAIRVSVHAGAHKTASTHFQSMLRRQSRMLERAGTALLLPRDLRRGTIPAQQIAAGRFAQDADGLRGARAALRAALGGADHAFLSDENILGSAHDARFRRTSTFYPEGHLRLHRVLTGLGLAGATVFLAIRDPATFLVSAYSQRVTSRGFVPFETFAGTIDVCTLYWSEFVERLARGPAVGRVVVWRFEDYPRIAPRILREMFPPETAAAIVPPGRLRNTGLSAEAHRRIAERARAGDAVTAAEARALRDAHPKGDVSPGFMPFSDALLAESARYYAEDVADIAAIPGVTLVAP